MYKDWSNTAAELSTLMRDVHAEIPEVVKGFSAMARAATADGALSPKVKELMALAISISIRCDGCVAFHARAAARHGASRQEVIETIGMCMYMGGGPSFTYGSGALEAFDQFADAD